tara:strand:+ start:6170 stop:6826 length:657 start_codon:yes stop_codon:yes gene_type:complete
MTIQKIAHRGLSINAPENSLQAFQDAMDNGFTMIEMDIQLSKDGVIVIHHDTYLDDQWVKNLTLDQLKERIPHLITLGEFFEEFPYEDIKIYLDLKGEDILAKKLVSFFLRNDINTKYIYCASFNINHLDYLYEFPLTLGYITYNKLDLPMVKFLINHYNIAFFAFSWDNLDECIIHYIHSLYKKVYVYTITNSLILKELQDVDVDGLISDIIIPKTE